MIEVTCDVHARTFQLTDAVAGRRVKLYCGCVHRVPGDTLIPTKPNGTGIAGPTHRTPVAAEAAAMPAPPPSNPASGLGEPAQSDAEAPDADKAASRRAAFDAAASRTTAAVRGTISVLGLLVKDPTALDLAAKAAGRSKTLDAGLVCGAIFIGAVLVTAYRLASGGPIDVPAETYLRLAAVPLTLTCSLAAALAIARKVFATEWGGCIENDIFGAGVTTMPIVLAMAVAQLVGAEPEALVLIGAAACVWSMLILFSALTRLARVPSGLALYLFPLMLLGVLLLTRWVVERLHLTQLPL